MSIHSLPDELLVHVLSYLDIKDLGKACQVNKQWDKLASHNSTWKKYGVFLESNDKNIKQSLKAAANGSIIVDSFEKILGRIKQLADKTSLDQKVTLTCSTIPEGGGNTTIAFNYTKFSQTPNNDSQIITEKYAFVRNQHFTGHDTLYLGCYPRTAGKYRLEWSYTLCFPETWISAEKGKEFLKKVEGILVTRLQQIPDSLTPKKATVRFSEVMMASVEAFKRIAKTFGE